MLRHKAATTSTTLENSAFHKRDFGNISNDIDSLNASSSNSKRARADKVPNSSVSFLELEKASFRAPFNPFITPFDSASGFARRVVNPVASPGACLPQEANGRPVKAKDAAKYNFPPAFAKTAPLLQFQPNHPAAIAHQKIVSPKARLKSVQLAMTGCIKALEAASRQEKLAREKHMAGMAEAAVSEQVCLGIKIKELNNMALLLESQIHKERTLAESLKSSNQGQLAEKAKCFDTPAKPHLEKLDSSIFITSATSEPSRAARANEGHQLVSAAEKSTDSHGDCKIDQFAAECADGSSNFEGAQLSKTQSKGIQEMNVHIQTLRNIVPHNIESVRAGLTLSKHTILRNTVRWVAEALNSASSAAAAKANAADLHGQSKREICKSAEVDYQQQYTALKMENAQLSNDYKTVKSLTSKLNETLIQMTAMLEGRAATAALSLLMDMRHKLNVPKDSNGVVQNTFHQIDMVMDQLESSMSSNHNWTQSVVQFHPSPFLNTVKVPSTQTVEPPLNFKSFNYSQEFAFCDFPLEYQTLTPSPFPPSSF